MAHAYLLQGDAIRALQEAAAPEIPPAFADYAAKIRVKADLLRNDLRAAGDELNLALARKPNDDGLWADLARLRAKEGDLAGAIQAGHKAALLNPHSLDALLLSASLARDQSGLRAALPWFNRVLAIDPKNIAALLELAATQGDTGQARAALATTRRVLAIDKANPQAFYLQAVLAARADRPDLARALLYHATPALDQLPGAMLLRGIVELQSGNTEQAISQFAPLLAAQPNNGRVRRLLALAYAQSGDDDAVIDALRPIADRADADSYTLTLIARALENVDDRALAATYLDRAARRNRGAAKAFDPGFALSLLARNDMDSPNNAESAVPFMQSLILGGHFEDAVGKARNLAALNPGVPLAHVLVGDAELAAGHDAEAADAYQRAASITLTEPIVLRQVSVLLRMGKAGNADAALAHFLDQNPTNQAALSLAAARYSAAGHWPQAIRMLEELRSRTGNSDAELLNSLALAWFNIGNPQRALAYARAAYALQPGNLAVTDTYGRLLFRTSLDKGPGLAMLEKAVSLAPDRPAPRLHLGEAYLLLGRKPAARLILAPLADKLALPEQAAAARLLAQL
jgi:tetratricopeptide (TPR) repeat protein